MVVTKTKKLNNRGMSFVEVLTASAVIAGTLLVASYFATQQSKMIAKSEEKVDSLGAEMELLSRSVRILTDVQDAKQLHTKGLCEFVDTDTKNYGIGNVTLKFDPTKVQSVFSTANWKRVIGNDWEVVGAASDCVTQEGTVCLKLSSNSPLFQKMKSQAGSGAQLTSFAKIKVAPSVVFEQFGEGGEIFPELEYKGSWDAKTVGFSIAVEVVVDNNGVRSNRRSKSSEFLWAADVEYCNVKRGADVLRNVTTNEPIRVLVSATGPGDPTGKKVYNATQYKKLVEHPVSIQMPRVIPTQGKHENGRSQVDPNFNLEVACQERVYRCPSASGGKRTYTNDIDVNFYANYTQANTVTSEPFVKFAPQVSFVQKNTNTDIINAYTKEYYLDQVDPYIYYKDEDVDRFYQGEIGGNNITKNDLDKLTFENRQKVAFNLKQTATWLVRVKNAGNNICDRVCDGRRDDTEYFYPRIDYTLLDTPFEGQKHYKHSYQSEMPIGCVVCYSKMCLGRTYKSFGVIQATADPKHGPQPMEPVDGVMPECALNDKESVNKIQPYEEFNSFKNQCIAAEITKSGVKYVAENCNTQLPVMCFGFGHFKVAENPFSGGGVKQYTHSQASRRCYEMGLERLDRSSMEKRFTEFKTTFYESFPRGIASTSENITEYINNAKTGMFLAPQSNEQEKEAYRMLSIYQPSMVGRKVWVGLKVDNGGDLVSVVPEIETLNNNRELYSIYYDSGSKIHMTRHNYHIPQIATAGNDAGLLIHNVRFRGVLAANEKQNRPFPFVCRRRSAPHAIYISSQRSSDFKDGDSICESQGGHFIPPTSPLGWSQAFQTLYPNDSIFPFPDPKASENDATQLPTAWVASRKLASNNWDLAQTERISKILSTANAGDNPGRDKTSKVNKYGEYVSERYPDPVEVERKRNLIQSIENSISNLENRIDNLQDRINKESDPAKKAALQSDKSDAQAELSRKRGDLADAKNIVVPIIDRPTRYVMCDVNNEYKLVNGNSCSGGRQISEDDLEGVIDRIKWVIASQDMPNNVWLKLRR